VLGEGIASKLQADGVCLVKAFMSDDDLGAMVDVADRCSHEGLFVRLPRELEEGYLGREGKGKVMHMNMHGEVEAFVKESPLKFVDEAISTVGRLVDPYTDREFGFQLAGKSDTLLVMPFNGDEDDYELCDVENEEAASFLQMMWRAKLAVIANSGRVPATLTLFPKVSEDADEMEPLNFTLEPGTLAAFLPDRHKFAYKCEEGKGLTSMCWFLEPAKSFNIVPTNDSAEATVIGIPPPDNENSIAVVSMCTRYAAGADEPEKLWAAYSKAAMDTFSEHPMTRWDVGMYYDKDADQLTSKSYTNHGGFSDGIELFDCRFFDISPAEAAGMDPTQRQVMEVSYVSLQGGGYEKKVLGGKPQQIGVFVGIDKNEWQSIPKDVAGGFAASSAANAITSNRFSYSLNLKGASMTIDTACSASLVCTHTAKLYLLHKQYDPCVACITTGVNLLLSPGTFIGCCGAGMLSHNGRCFTFNQSADGYARGESTASHCIKPRQYTKGDDLCMYAGSQVNQDGRSASLTAPNGPAQEKCNLAVMRECNLSPTEIDTTECHGTGTSLGDPIEVGAYKKVMRTGGDRHAPVIVTTCKSNIGHCEGSAGIGGFLKCCLMSMNSEGCPNVHLSSYNPHMDISGFQGIFPTEGLAMRYDTSYNGVLSFGFGGTNACAQVWGLNVWNSRVGGGKSSHQQFMDTVRDAPVQEVLIAGDDWEDWEMAGMERDAKDGDRWAVEIDEEGGVHYHRSFERHKDLGDTYQLAGTFNGWEMEELEMDEAIHGLYAATVSVGASGAEHFQILVDGNTDMIFHPSSPSCTRRSEKVQGPDAAGRDHAWCIQGREGDKFRIEFYRSEGDHLSINWIRVR